MAAQRTAIEPYREDEITAHGDSMGSDVLQTTARTHAWVYTQYAKP